MLGFGPWNMFANEYLVAAATDCIRCGEAARVAEYGYCFQCHCAVRAEPEAGLEVLSRYLHGWRLFADWCAERCQGIA